MAREGGCEWYQSIGLIFLNISANFLIFLKDPGPLKNKKPLWAVKQLLKERHCIKERAGLIIEWRCAPCSNHGYRGTLQSAILFTAAKRATGYISKKIHFNSVNPHAAILKTPVWGLPASTVRRCVALFNHINAGAAYSAIHVNNLLKLMILCVLWLRFNTYNSHWLLYVLNRNHKNPIRYY